MIVGYEKRASYSKQLELLEAACTWEDWIYNLTRPLKTLRVEVNDGQRRWQPRSPAMAAGLRIIFAEELRSQGGCTWLSQHKLGRLPNFGHWGKGLS